MDAIVVMIISLLLLIVLPLRAQGCNNSAAFKFLARRFKLIFDQKNCATSRLLFGLLLNLRDEIIPLLRCNIRRACQPMSSSGTSKRCPIFAGFGSILLPGPLLLARSPFLFGYAKPVPVNFGALRNPRIGMVLVAAAGPAMNVGLAIVAALSFHLVVYLPVITGQWVALNLKNAIVINVILAVFNLFPLPPLDGGRIAVGLLPNVLANPLARLEPYGMIILIGLLIVLPLFGSQLGVDLSFVSHLISSATNSVIKGILLLTGNV